MQPYITAFLNNMFVCLFVFSPHCTFKWEIRYTHIACSCLHYSVKYVLLTGFLCNCCSSGTHGCCMGRSHFTRAGLNAVWIRWQDHQVMEGWSLWEHLHWYIGAFLMLSTVKQCLCDAEYRQCGACLVLSDLQQGSALVKITCLSCRSWGLCARACCDKRRGVFLLQ